MPKWFWNVLLFIILALGLGFFMLVIVKSFSSERDPDNQTPIPAQPTANMTAVAGLTPTPGSEVMATAVVLAWPTPSTVHTVGDVVRFTNELKKKAMVSEKDINIAAELSSPGEGHQTVKLKTFFDIDLDDYSKISVVWVEWYLAYLPQNIEIKVEPGTLETDTAKMELSNDGKTYLQKNKANVTVIVKDLGVIGPVIRFNQSYDFFKDIKSGWKIFLDMRDAVQKESYADQLRLLTNDTQDLAKADSFAPLMESGLRSPEFTDRLYQAYVDSLTTPGDGHIYNRLLDYATLVATDRTPERDMGFSGIESFTVIVPKKPITPCDYVFAGDMKTPVLPIEYCTTTYSILGITEEMKNTLKDDVVAKLKDVDYSEIFRKIEGMK